MNPTRRNTLLPVSGKILHTHMHTYLHTYTCTHKHTHINMHTTHTYTCTHKLTHACTQHTHTCTKYTVLSDCLGTKLGLMFWCMREQYAKIQSLKPGDNHPGKA